MKMESFCIVKALSICTKIGQCGFFLYKVATPLEISWKTNPENWPAKLSLLTMEWEKGGIEMGGGGY